MSPEDLATHQAAMFVQRYRKVAKPTMNALSGIIDCWCKVVESKGHHVARQYIMDVTGVLSDMTNNITLEVKKKSPNDL